MGQFRPQTASLGLLTACHPGPEVEVGESGRKGRRQGIRLPGATRRETGGATKPDARPESGFEHQGLGLQLVLSLSVHEPRGPEPRFRGVSPADRGGIVTWPQARRRGRSRAARAGGQAAGQGEESGLGSARLGRDAGGGRGGGGEGDPPGCDRSEAGAGRGPGASARPGRYGGADEGPARGFLGRPPQGFPTLPNPDPLRGREDGLVT
ncbi:uncharacterized protein LOC144457702 [Phascolarctos cinereus]